MNKLKAIIVFIFIVPAIIIALIGDIILLIPVFILKSDNWGGEYFQLTKSIIN